MIDWKKYAENLAKTTDSLRGELALISETTDALIKEIKKVRNDVKFKDFDGVLRAETLNILANSQFFLQAIKARNDINKSYQYTEQIQILQKLENSD